MFRTETGIDNIQLVWKTKRYEVQEFKDKKGKKRELIKVHSEIYKPSTLNLKEFIIEYYRNRFELGELMVDFMVNGVNLGDWFHTQISNYGLWSIGLKANIIYSFNYGHNHFENFMHTNFHHQKVKLKQILGQKITFDDAVNIYHDITKPSKVSEKHKRWAKSLIEEENSNVMLYCSGCCEDRYCGAFCIKIEEQEDTIIWKFIGYYRSFRNLVFDKQQYFDGFGEYIDFINTELKERNIEEVTLL